MSTRVYKDYRGAWAAETWLSLSPNHKLRILTMKRYDGRVYSCADVYRGDGQSVIHASERDYSEPLGWVALPRVMRKDVEAEHHKALAGQHGIEARARAFYKLETSEAAL